MCNVLDASRKKVLASSQALNSSDPAQEGVLNAILAPIQQAGTSRAAIVRERVSMKCPGAQLDAVQAEDRGLMGLAQEDGGGLIRRTQQSAVST